MSTSHDHLKTPRHLLQRSFQFGATLKRLCNRDRLCYSLVLALVLLGFSMEDPTADRDAVQLEVVPSALHKPAGGAITTAVSDAQPPIAEVASAKPADAVK